MSNDEQTTLATGIYQHYKGSYYRVLGLSRHSESLDILVVYQALYGDYGLWVRPHEMFVQNILIDEELVPRFRFIHDSNHPPVVR